MALRIVQRPSPNHDERPAGTPIDMLVMHYTGMRTTGEALARLCDPDAKVSAHYTIGRDGCVYAHVPETRRAWHAGVSYWAGERNINARSIGIELVNPGHEFGYEPFPEEQIAALIDLAGGILSRHPIPAHRVVGHSDVAPARKMDPGERFPWKQLAEFGIGVWPDNSSPACGGGAERSEAEGGSLSPFLKRFGYGVPPEVDIPLKDVIAAFQRHFRPSCIDGIADDECAWLLGGLADAYAA